jgi:septal ring factor EnvC (AmiA/AmiB activator)
MAPRAKRQLTNLENLAVRFTESLGSPASIIIHTLAFVAFFALAFFGIALDTVLLILTTLVSLEAIYLALFIQMTVNRNTQSLEEVEEDIDEIQEDVEEIEKDIDEIQSDVDKIEAEEMQENLHDSATRGTLDKLQVDLQKLMEDIELLKNQKK